MTIESIDQKFNPCDSLATSMAMITREEWEAVKARLAVLQEVYESGIRMRQTAVVDDDFPEMMHNFDTALRKAGKE